MLLLRKPNVLLGISQIGKAPDSESAIYWFEPSMPNCQQLVSQGQLLFLFQVTVLNSNTGGI